MNEIIYNNSEMPVVSDIGLLAASEPFFHADRILDFHVMIYVLDGTIFVTEDTRSFEINKGGLLFLKSGIRHFGEREIPRGTRWFYVHFYFNGQPVPEPFADAEKQLLPRAPAKYSAALPKSLTGLSGSEIEEKIIELWRYCGSEDKCRLWYINLRLAELLSFIALKEQNDTALRLSDRIAEYLGKNTSKPFSAKALENEFFLSYKRMAAVFKSEKGISMQRYHDRMKMEHARSLLRSALMSVGEVSAAVGFSDPLYFSRRFREINGSSPTEFRRAAAEMFSDQTGRSS